VGIGAQKLDTIESIIPPEGAQLPVTGRL